MQLACRLLGARNYSGRNVSIVFSATKPSLVGNVCDTSRLDAYSVADRRLRTRIIVFVRHGLLIAELYSEGLRVVAEGVEDDADLRTLRQFGCDQAQGYFMSRPLPVKELEEWLRASPWATTPKRVVAFEETFQRRAVSGSA